MKAAEICRESSRVEMDEFVADGDTAREQAPSGMRAEARELPRLQTAWQAPRVRVQA